MTKKQLTKEEKIEKAKKLTEELHDLKLTPEELKQVSAGYRPGGYTWTLEEVKKRLGIYKTGG